MDNDWVVEGGLAAGERIVVEGIGKLRPGITVKPVAIASGAGLPDTPGDASQPRAPAPPAAAKPEPRG